MDVGGSNVQAATYGLTSLITQLVVIPKRYSVITELAIRRKRIFELDPDRDTHNSSKSHGKSKGDISKY